MRTNLIIFGVIFLVIGGLFYFMPMQKITADTTTAGTGGADTRISSARISIPIEWAYASGIIGFVLLMFGLMIPNPIIRSNTNNRSSERVVQSNDAYDVGDGNRRTVVRERTVTHKVRRDDDFD